MKSHNTHLLIFFLLPWFTFSSLHGQNTNDLKKSVPLWFEYDSLAQKGVLKWMNDPAASSYNVGTVNYLSNPTFQFLQTVSGGVDSFIIPDFKVGQNYHYRVSKSTGAGFIDFGVEQPFPEFRGRCLLVLDDRFTAALDDQLIQWEADIEGDGWIVDTIHVNTGLTPVTVKNKIKNWYLNHSNCRSVILFGAVPVPYSGNTAIDGHPDHSGAWSSDTYYGDMDGSWTDFSVNSTTATRPENQNIPGDGKFDAIVIPSDLELEIGRIDFSKLPAFTQSEQELLKAYLVKNHRWRTGANPYPQRGLMENNFASFDEGFGQNAWRNFVPMFGVSNVKVGDYETELVNEKYLYSYACGGGSYTSCGGIGTTQNLWAAKSIQSVFTMTFGSYFGDYDSQNNFLRSALASGDILTNMWAGRPNWILSSMASGAHIGHATRLTQNANGGFFFSGNGPRFTHVALMGDPTLRLHPLPMIKNLSALLENRIVRLEWERGDTSQQKFVIFQVNQDDHHLLAIVEGKTEYELPCPTPGENMRFLVKPLQLTQTASGSYLNTGTGVSAAIYINPDSFPSAQFTYDSDFERVDFQNISTQASAVEWSFGDGTFSNEYSPTHTFPQAGQYLTCLYVHNEDSCPGSDICMDIKIKSSFPEMIQSTTNHVTCFGGQDGSVFVETEGGKEDNVSYYWNTGHFGKNISMLAAGEYTLTIKNLLTGDSIIQNYSILQPDQISAVVTVTNSTGNDGKIDFQVSGGTPPYSYAISGPGQPSTVLFDQLKPGVYTVIITDIRGCSLQLEIEVLLITGTKEVSLDVKLFPNPTQGMVIVQASEPIQKLKVRNESGIILGGITQITDLEWKVDASGWPSATYWLEIEMKSGEKMVTPLVKIDP